MSLGFLGLLWALGRKLVVGSHPSKTAPRPGGRQPVNVGRDGFFFVFFVFFPFVCPLSFMLRFSSVTFWPRFNHKKGQNCLQSIHQHAYFTGRKLNGLCQTGEIKDPTESHYKAADLTTASEQHQHFTSEISLWVRKYLLCWSPTELFVSSGSF